MDKIYRILGKRGRITIPYLSRIEKNIKDNGFINELTTPRIPTRPSSIQTLSKKFRHFCIKDISSSARQKF